MNEVNNTLLQALITGLEYNDKDNLYSFKHRKYALKSSTVEGKKITHYFVNINEPTDLKIILCSSSNGIPTYDGFNDKSVDKKLRKLEYLRLYYKTTIYKKRQEKRKLAKSTEHKEKPVKVKVKKEKAELEPIKCAYCGKVFTPKFKNQKFHTDECRKKYYSERQATEIKQARQEDKVCPICGTHFTGTPRDKYCSPECFKLAQKGLRRERYIREKALVEKYKQENSEKKVIVVKKQSK